MCCRRPVSPECMRPIGRLQALSDEGVDFLDRGSDDVVSRSPYLLRNIRSRRADLGGCWLEASKGCRVGWRIWQRQNRSKLYQQNVGRMSVVKIKCQHYVNILLTFCNLTTINVNICISCRHYVACSCVYRGIFAHNRMSTECRQNAPKLPEKKRPTPANLVVEEGDAVRRADQCQVAIVGGHAWVVRHLFFKSP
jgi:hypothetical protein